MKKKFILSSILTIALCLSIAVGATFALFTSESRVNIAVTSGNVEVAASVDEESVKLYSLGVEQTSGKFENLGTATLATDSANGTTLTLENVTPGDKVAFTIDIENKSTVTVKYRTKLTCVEDNGLYDGLVYSIDGNDSAFVSNWEKLQPGSAVTRLDCTIELPENSGNEYQRKTCKLAFSVEAVQGNATYKTVRVTTENIQDYLDGKYGSLDDMTLVLAGGDYGVLELGRATAYEGSNTEYYTLKGEDLVKYDTVEDFKAVASDTSVYYGNVKYVRSMSFVTLKAAEGETVNIAGMIMKSAHMYSTDAVTAHDYVLNRDAVGSNYGYWLVHNVNGLTFEGLNFVGNADIESSLEETKINGVTFDGCTFTTGTTAAGVQALRYYNENNNGTVRNLVVKNCKFVNSFQGIYTSHIRGVTVTDSEFDTTGHNAIAVQCNGDKGACNHGKVVITNNTFKNIGDRIIRFNTVGADTQITIKGNTATESGDRNGEVIKATSLAEGITYDISGNSWGDGKKVANSEFADR